MVLAVLALNATFNFAGGFDHEMIESVFDSLQKPVVAVAYDLKPRKKLEFGWVNPEDFRAKLKNLSGFESIVDGSWGLSKGRWPHPYFVINSWDEYVNPFRFLKSELRTETQNGLVTLKTLPGPVPVSS